MVSSLSNLRFILVSSGLSDLSMGCLMVLVSLMDFGADNFVIASMSVQGQSLVHVAMLNSVLSRSLDLVEELVVLVLDVVHNLGASVMAHIMLISVTWVIRVSGSIVSEVLILFIVVVVVISSPEGSTFMMLGVLLMATLMVGGLLVLGTEVLVSVLSVVVSRWVFLSVVQSVFALRVMRFIQRILIVMTAFVVTVSLCSDVFMMNLTFGITTMEASMLVSPKKFRV